MPAPVPSGSEILLSPHLFHIFWLASPMLSSLPGQQRPLQGEKISCIYHRHDGTCLQSWGEMQATEMAKRWVGMGVWEHSFTPAPFLMVPACRLMSPSQESMEGQIRALTLSCDFLENLWLGGWGGTHGQLGGWNSFWCAIHRLQLFPSTGPQCTGLRVIKDVMGPRPSNWAL